MKIRQFAMIALSVSTLGLSQYLVAEENYGTVINLAGRQRMLTQKMSKEILLATYDPEFADYFKGASQTALLFDSTLDGLLNGNSQMGLPGTKARRIVRQIDKINQIWEPFNEAVGAISASKEPTPDALKTVIEDNLNLLSEMNKAVKLYEKEYSTEGGKSDFAVTINLAGKQRMLTQKMSKEFVLIALGKDAANNQLSLLETYELFDRTLNGLKNGDETLELDPSLNTQEIIAQLDKVINLWSAFKPLMKKATDGGQSAITKEDVKQVAADNIPLLKAMNEAVKMYETASKD